MTVDYATEDGTATGSFADAATGSGFVSRTGKQLFLGKTPYRFSGINAYNLNSDGLCWYSYDAAQLDATLTELENLGGKSVLRAWFFQDLATSGGTRDWTAFDRTLDRARAHGFKVIATLGNHWADCDQGYGRKDQAWYATGYQTVDPVGTVSYRNWVGEIVDRYKDDPAILMWEPINEPETSSVTDVCGPGAATTLQNFMADVGGLIKSIDSNHLVTTGVIGSGQCGASGPEYEALHALGAVDVCSWHDYGSPLVPMPGDAFNGLQLRLNQCAVLNKPLVVGEAGIIPNEIGGTLAARAQATQAKLLRQIPAGVAGYLPWAWNRDGSLLHIYDIGPGDPVLGTLGAFGDYDSAAGSLTFAPGETSKTITIKVNGDLLDEPNETYFVNASNPVNATIADGQGLGTILDDDAEPALSIDDVVGHGGRRRPEDGHLHGLAVGGKWEDGHHGVRDLVRHGDAGRRLRLSRRHPDVRAGPDHQDDRRLDQRRHRLRARRDLQRRPQQPHQRVRHRRPRRGHDRERRQRSDRERRQRDDARGHPRPGRRAGERHRSGRRHPHDRLVHAARARHGDAGRQRTALHPECGFHRHRQLHLQGERRRAESNPATVTITVIQPLPPGCTKGWAAEVDGFWSDETKWTPAGVPTATDDVCLTGGGYTVTVEGTQSAGSVTVGATGNLERPTLLITDSPVLGAGQLSSATGFLNHGRVVFENQLGHGVFLHVTAGTFRNAPDGVVEASVGVATVNGPVVNEGAFTVAAGASLALGGSVPSFDQDAGVLIVEGSFPATGATLTYNGGAIPNPLVLQGATLALAAPAAVPKTFIFEGASNVLAGDVLSGHTVVIRDSSILGAGQLSSATGFLNHGRVVFENQLGHGVFLHVTAGTFRNAPDGVVEASVGVATVNGPVVNEGAFTVAAGASLALGGSVPSFDQDAGVLIVEGSFPATGATLTYNGGAIPNPLVLQGATLALAAPAAVPKTFIFEGASNVLAGDVLSGHTVVIRDSSILGAGQLSSATGFLNHGRVRFENQLGHGVFLHVTAGTFRNAPDGVVEASVGVATVNGPVVNEGAFTVAAGASLALGGSVPSFDQDAGVLIVEGSFPATGATLTYNGGAIPNPLVLQGATLALAAPAAVPKTFIFEGASNVLAGDVLSGHTVVIRDSSILGAGQLSSATGFLNHGRVRFENQLGHGVFLHVTAGTFTNAADGSLEVGVGSATVNGPVVNAGSFTVAGGASVNIAGSYTQAPSGELDIELVGPVTGSVLALPADSASIDGVLRIRFAGFTPTAGQMFTLLTYASRTGTFALEMPDGFTGSVAYGATSAVLTVNGAVENTAPVVDAGGDASVNEGALFTRSGSFTDPDSDTWTGTVSYGDGSGVQPLTLNADKTFDLSHTYADNGPFTVTVTVNDGSVSGSDSFLVTVQNVDPVVDAGPDKTIPPGGTFSSSGSFVDPGADTWTATVDYGDGSGVQPLALNADKTFALSHVYASAGVFTVTVTVTDDDGGTGTDTAVVTVEAGANTPPAVDAGGDGFAFEGTSFSRFGFFIDPDADEWTATVDYGDGSGTQSLPLGLDKSFQLEHTYADDGAHTVVVTVDDGTDTGTDSFDPDGAERARRSSTRGRTRRSPRARRSRAQARSSTRGRTPGRPPWTTATGPACSP